MATYYFETITPAQALAYDASVDTLVFGDSFNFRFPGVGFNADGTVVLSLGGSSRSVTFGAGMQGETGFVAPNGQRLLIGTTGADAIGGTAAADQLYGGPGADTLYGGAGADFIVGGAGSDLFVVQPGDSPVGGATDNIGWDASDRITFGGPAGTEANTVKLSGSDYAAALTTANYEIGHGYTYVIIYGGPMTYVFADSHGDHGQADEVVTISSFPADITYANIVAAPGGPPPPAPPPLPMAWAPTPPPQTATEGTAGDDKLVNYDAVGHVLHGYGGNDTLQGMSHNDTLDGGAGDDILAGSVYGTTTVTYENATGGVTASLAVAGYQTIGGGQGADWLQQIQVLQGSSYNDTLTGGGYMGSTVRGGDGDDRLMGGYDPVRLEGGGGADTLTASSGYAGLDGGSGDDVIAADGYGARASGGDGADRITGWDSAGGRGDDTLSAPATGGGPANLTGAAGADSITGSAFADVLNGGSGVNVVMGGEGNDTIQMIDTSADDGLGAGSGRVDGGAGFDTVSYAGSGPAASVPVVGDLASGWASTQAYVDSAGHSYVASSVVLLGIEGLRGGLGADQLTGSSDADRLEGDLGADTIFGGAGADTIYGVADASFPAFGESGNLLRGDDGGDLIYGGNAADDISGGAGNDQINGNGGADIIAGDDGADTITASATGSAAAMATIHGGAGDDRLISYGSSYARGDEGNDVLTGGVGFDDLNGNMGDDTASGGYGDDWVVGGKDNDRLSGDVGSDIVYGNLGNDTCDGGAGIDLVRGGQGNDVVNGGADIDWLSGDRGDDTLTGGAGYDIFHTFGDAGLDLVTDFNVDEDFVQLDPGTVYTVSQQGADTVIAMAGGGRMVLAGVDMAKLPVDWLFVA